MKSQAIKVRNLPQDPQQYYKSVRVKPILLLVLLLGLGVIFVCMKSYLLPVGSAMIVLALFALTMMPDRTLCQFTKEYLILYNLTDRSMCTIISWDEIVSWRYEYHGAADLLVVTLIDGTTEVQEMYSKLAVRSMMKMFAPGKEEKKTRSRK